MLEVRSQLSAESRRQQKEGQADFLERVKDTILREIQRTNEGKALKDYDVNWNEDVHTVTCHTIFDIPPLLKEQKVEFHITHINWNSTGEWLAVAFGNRNEIGWCMSSGYIAIYSHDKLLQLIDIQESYVTSLAFHPTKSNLLVAGTYDGTLKLFKLDENDYRLMSTTPIQFSHRDPVVDVTWLRHRQDKSVLVASLSIDGKIHLWSAKNQLQQPVQSYHFTNAREVPLSTSSFAFIDIHSGSTLKNTTIPTTDSYFLLACETGDLCKTVFKGINLLNTSKLRPSKSPPTLTSLNKPRRNPIEFQYASGIGYMELVRCSPFHRHCFLSLQDDLCRLYHVLESRDKITLQPSPQSRLLSAAFSPFRPCVIACGAENGKLYLYDLLESSVHPSLEIEVGAPVCQISFHPSSNNTLVTADDSGSIKLWRLNNKFSSLV
eukprot:CAMPEP_0117418158 /NCGR_PEP_ID=MMETSP0758-20121206/6_1 /TAXON_ID=63605 /ORGANISM="Percolomonas cosmopolitus, Strain AE-1 (ATCC 50343)" /LENGTH=434 /DNA_ID=CAMNT_0005198515 /DNA_START=220 /DNA_END=1521 /DNA_ORIENTATION=+